MQRLAVVARVDGNDDDVHGPCLIFSNFYYCHSLQTAIQVHLFFDYNFNDY